MYKRRSKAYSEIRMATIKDLDIMASTLLAICYSKNRAPTPESQGCIQFDCVAVCQVDKDLWVAANKIKIQDENIDKLLEVMKWDKYPFEGDFYIVTIPKEDVMHAEMILLSELRGTGKNTRYIGVSKPCCELCKQELDRAGIGYAQWHDDPIKKWTPPI